MSPQLPLKRLSVVSTAFDPHKRVHVPDPWFASGVLRVLGHGNLVSLALRMKVSPGCDLSTWPSVLSLKVLTLDIDCTFFNTVKRPRWAPRL